MNSEEKFYAYIMSLVAIVAIALISGLIYYNLEQGKLPLLLVEKGINPAVVRCINVSWSITSNYIICNKILANEGLSKKEAKKLVEELR